MLDLHEGVRDIFLDAQQPIFDAVRAEFNRRLLKANEYVKEWRQQHPERVRAWNKTAWAKRRDDVNAARRAKRAAARSQ